MIWILAAAAPLLIGGVFQATGALPAAILAYHALCAAAILRCRARLGPLFRREGARPGWIAGTTLLFAGAIALGPLLYDPAPHRAEVAPILFPWGFAWFAAYTMLLHAPLEEIFWRGVVSGSPAANGAFFYLVHAVPMGMVLGTRGWLLALPTGLAGAAWTFVTARTRSLWPSLISHWAVDALILAGMWLYFVR